MISRRIYVASSWRNEYQQYVVEQLREHCAAVYDFRNPPKKSGFGWEQTMRGYVPGVTDTVRADDYLGAINDPIAIEGFDADFAAMQWADTFVLVLPCGRSAHLELGWAVGAGKEAFILLCSSDNPEGEQVVPELMYRMADDMFTSVTDLVDYLEDEPEAPADEAERSEVA